VTDRSARAPGVARRDASYTYDRLNQLATAATTFANWEYGYDTIQNLTRTRKQVGSAQPVEQTFGYGENAGPNALTRAGATQLTYDGVGQLKRYSGYDLKFDPLGQLVQASKSGGKTLQYFYDPLGGRRLLLVILPGGQKQVYRYPVDGYEQRMGDEVWRVRAGGQDVELRRALGLRMDATLLDELTAYVNAPAGKPKPLPQEWLDLDGDGDGFDSGDLAVAQQAFWNGLPAGTPRVEWRFVAKDRLGSGVAVTDRAGDAVSSRDYEPYGATSRRTGAQPTQGFTGADVEPDEDLGLIRMGGRYYAPAIGRWISPDHHIGESPKSMSGTLLESNLYSYARGNPIAFVDPSGGQAQDDPATYAGPGSIDYGTGMGMLITQSGGRIESVGSIPEGGGSRGTFVQPKGVERAAALTPPKPGGVPGWLRDAKARWEAEDRANAQRGVYTQLPGWDDLQTGLDMLSMAMDATGAGASVSWIPDMLNCSISAARGDFDGAQLALAAAIPVLGVAANLARVARAGKKAGALIRGAENIRAFESLVEARAAAKQMAGLGDDTVKYVSELGPMKGLVVGSASADGLRGWRIDFDPAKGYHVNWWDKTGGAARSAWVYGANIIKGGTEGDFLNFLQHIQ
jgi:RHS repeat-associated protein